MRLSPLVGILRAARLAVHVRWLLTVVVATGLQACARQAAVRDAPAQERRPNVTAPHPPPPAPAAVSQEADLSHVERRIIELTNSFRIEQGRQPVKPNPQLTAASRYFAGYLAGMGDRDKLSHTADGAQPADRAARHGYKYCLVSENIAYLYQSTGYQTDELAKAFTDGWIKSPGHRKNMLDFDVVDSSVAVARGSDGTYYGVQMFGRPESMQVKFKIANRSDKEVSYKVGDETFQLPPRVIRTHTDCRPPEVRIQWPSGRAPIEAANGVLRPENGAEFVIDSGPDGRLSLQRK